jgi:hypothetical protein
MGQEWGPPPDAGHRQLSDRYRAVCEMLARELDRPAVPDNWRAQFGAVLRSPEYQRAVGIVESWPGVAPGRLEEPLVGAERNAAYAAANRGMRAGAAACEHGILTGMMVCPTCEPREQRSAEASAQRTALEHRLREVTAERDRLRRELLGEVLGELEHLRDVFMKRALKRFEAHETGSVDQGESVDCDGPGCTDPNDCHAVAAVTTWTQAVDLVQTRIAELRATSGDGGGEPG